jgi:hypothetical protein
MANSSPFLGADWPTTLTPTGDEPHGNANQEIFDLRKGVKLRLDHEHLAFAGSSVGGWHFQGTAVPFYRSGKPTAHADEAETAFASTDSGRLWVDSDDDTLHFYDHADTDFHPVRASVDDETLEIHTDGKARIKAGQVDTAHLAAGAAEIVKLGAGVAQIAIGTYSGTGSAGNNAVSGLAFKPDVVIFNRDDVQGILMAFLNQASANIAPIIDSNGSSETTSSLLAAFTFTSDGWTFPKDHDRYNANGTNNYSYIAVKVTT